MQIDPHMPQRMSIVIEKNKSKNWSVSAYLVSADGRRERCSLGVFESYDDAANSLRKACEGVTI